MKWSSAIIVPTAQVSTLQKDKSFACQKDNGCTLLQQEVHIPHFNSATKTSSCSFVLAPIQIFMLPSACHPPPSTYSRYKPLQICSLLQYTVQQLCAYGLLILLVLVCYFQDVFILFKSPLPKSQEQGKLRQREKRRGVEDDTGKCLFLF